MSSGWGARKLRRLFVQAYASFATMPLIANLAVKSKSSVHFPILLWISLLSLTHIDLTASAATFQKVAPFYSELDNVPLLLLKGTIEQGDEQKLSDLLSEIDDSEDGSMAILSLNSDGGNFDAGMKLAKIVRENRVGTVVESGNRCLSACAIVFLGGRGFWPTGNVGFYLNRFVEPGGQVGFHSPYLGKETVRELEETESISEIVDRTRDSISQLIAVLIENKIDPNILYQIVSKGADQTFDIETVDDLMQFRANIPPFPANLIKLSREDKIRNVCIKLMKLYYRAVAGDMSQSLDPNPITYDHQNQKFWDEDKRINKYYGFEIDDNVRGAVFCGSPIDKEPNEEDPEDNVSTVTLIGGHLAPSLELLTFTNQGSGWSSILPDSLNNNEFIWLAPLNYWYLDGATRLKELPPTITRAIRARKLSRE